MRKAIGALHILVLAALLLSGVAKGFVLCQTGEICHACDGCGQADLCGDQPQDCIDCCKVADAQPDAAFQRAVLAVAFDGEGSPAAILSDPPTSFEFVPSTQVPEPFPPTVAAPPSAPLLTGNGLRAPPASA